VDYNKKKISDFVSMVLSNTDMCPCLMIGKYVNEFKQIYKDTIERAYSLSEVRGLIEEYEGVTNVNSKYLVIEGVGYLSSVGQNSLLKFIEESKLPIILLSYNDKVSPIIMSRMKIVVKRWYPLKDLKFLRVTDALRTLEEKKKEGQMKEYEEIQFLANNCPTLYSIKQQAGDPFDYLNNRMINIMCSR
jgi:hypothetical protein